MSTDPRYRRRSEQLEGAEGGGGQGRQVQHRQRLRRPGEDRLVGDEARLQAGQGAHRGDAAAADRT